MDVGLRDRRLVAEMLVPQRDESVHIGRHGEGLLGGPDGVVQRRLLQQRDLLATARTQLTELGAGATDDEERVRQRLLRSMAASDAFLSTQAVG